MLKTFNAMRDTLKQNKNFDFYAELVSRSKTDDIIPRMETYFLREIGNADCPTGTFRNIIDRALDYHRRDFPPYILNEVSREYETLDGRHVYWKEFMSRCQEELDISFDLDEVLGCIYQWMKYNNMYSLHEVFKTLEIDRINFKDSCKKAGSNLDVEHINRVFNKYCSEDTKNNYLDYDRFEKQFDDMKPSLIAKFKDQQVDKATIFEALRSRLKILG